MSELTNNLKDFNNNDMKTLSKSLTLYSNGKLTKTAKDFFYCEGVQFYKNKNSGLIFLSNEDWDTIIINPKKNKLDLWINTPYYGSEGFLSIELINDIFSNFDNYNIEDIEYINNFKKYMSRKELNLFNKYIKKYKISLD